MRKAGQEMPRNVISIVKLGARLAIEVCQGSMSRKYVKESHNDARLGKSRYRILSPRIKSGQQKGL